MSTSSTSQPARSHVTNARAGLRVAGPELHPASTLGHVTCEQLSDDDRAVKRLNECTSRVLAEVQDQLADVSDRLNGLVAEQFAAIAEASANVARTEGAKLGEVASAALDRLLPGVEDVAGWLEAWERMPAPRRRRLLLHRALRGLWSPDEPDTPTPLDREVRKLFHGVVRRTPQEPRTPQERRWPLLPRRDRARASDPAMLAVASLSAAPGAPSLAA